MNLLPEGHHKLSIKLNALDRNLNKNLSTEILTQINRNVEKLTEGRNLSRNPIRHQNSQQYPPDKILNKHPLQGTE